MESYHYKLVNNYLIKMSKKRLIIILVIFLLVLTYCGHSYVTSFGSHKKANQDYPGVHVSSGKTYFHDYIDGSNMGYVAKMSSNKSTIQIQDIDYRHYQWSDSARHIRDFMAITNFEIYRGIHGSYSFFIGRPLYFQIDTGIFNWSYERIPDGLGGGLSGHFKSGGNWSDGPWYFIYGAYVEDGTSELEVWINTTDDVTISILNGTETFLYSREDFHAILNAGWGHGTFMFSGTKELDIENMFFGWFEPWGAMNGWEELIYTDPFGNQGELKQWDFLGKTIKREGDINLSRVITGPPGQWIFKANMISMSLLPNPLEILLWGSDIKLPE